MIPIRLPLKRAALSGFSVINFRRCSLPGDALGLCALVESLLGNDRADSSSPSSHSRSAPRGLPDSSRRRMSPRRCGTMGTYRSGQTWVEPAVANDITTKNASAVEPARALVVLMTNETSSLKSKDH